MKQAKVLLVALLIGAGVAVVSLYTSNFSPLAMALAVLAGVIIADRKLHHIIDDKHHG